MHDIRCACKLRPVYYNKSSMSTPELDQQFFAALGGMELQADGIQDYEDVTTDASDLQADLVDCLIAIGGVDLADEAVANQKLEFLHMQIEKAFERRGRLQRGDYIIASGDSVVVMVDSEGDRYVEIISKDARLHGTIVRTYVIEAPLIVDVEDDDVLNPEQDAVMQISAALELVDAAMEEVDPDYPDTPPVPLDENLRVFLPLAYPDLRMKRRAS